MLGRLGTKLNDIDKHHNEECIILRHKFNDEEDSTFQHTGYKIQQDIKNQREEYIVKVAGNIEGYETPRSVSIFRPQQVTRTEEYKNRKSKFYKWIETSKISNEE